MNAIKADEPPSCRVSRSVNLYADGELEPNRAVEVEMHLAVCTNCREELETIRAMRKSLRRSTVRQAPKGFEERMRALCAQKTAGERSTELGVESGEARSSEGKGHDAATEHDKRRTSEIGERAVAAVQVSSSDGEASPGLAGSPRRRRKFARFRISWGTAMAMAAAASFVVAFFATRSQRPDGVARLPLLKATSAINPLAVPSANEAARKDSFDQLIDRLVTLHAHPVPPETDNFDEAVARFNGTLGVGLDRRTLRRPFGANFNGARMHVIEFQEPEIEPTAELRYTMQGHRITIYVFDPRRVPMRLTHLSQRVVRSAPVYVGRVRGFSVAAAENSGVGYALASDLDADKSAQLVAEIR
jgi:anti-sigma factor RsiW